MGQTRLQIAQSEIEEFFRPKKAQIIRRRALYAILSKKKTDWNLAYSTTARKFITFLVDQKILTEYEMNFPHRKEIRYAVGEGCLLQIIQSLRPKSYFSHATALSLHNLTDKRPRTIYLNTEQPPKEQYSGELTQEGIDTAFQNRCRVSKNTAALRGKRICLLNGKHTGQLGVVAIEGQASDALRVTDIERTLIDCTVRPVYAASMRSIVEGYRNASKLIITERLLELLGSLGYVYPYHQAIGFYLERSGAYSEDRIRPFEALTKKFDFYLTYQMKNPKYSKRWRLHYPRSL